MAAETVKNTVEQFTTAGNVAFKDAVEKSLASLNEVNAHSKKNLEAVIASVTASSRATRASRAGIATSRPAARDPIPRPLHPRPTLVRSAAATAWRCRATDRKI